MTLDDLIVRLDELPDEAIIYVQGPAVADAPAIALAATSDLDPPMTVGDYEYLIEIYLVREVLEVWSAWRDGREPTREERLEAVVHYAARDAYLPVEGSATAVD